MNRRDSLHYIMLSMLLDLLVALCGLQLGRIAYINLINNHELTNVNPMVFFGLLGILWIVVGNVLHVYHPYRNYRAVDELQHLIIASIFHIFLITGILFFSDLRVPRPFIVLSFAFSLMGMVGWRTTSRLLFRRLSQGHYRLRNVLIVGANELALDMARNIEKNSWMGLTVIGFVDEGESANRDVLGDFDSICTIVEEYDVDEVVLSLPFDHPKMQNVIAKLHSTPVHTHVLPNYFSLALHRAEMEEWGDMQLINLRAPALFNYQRVFKRVFDFIAAAIGLAVLWPIMLIIARSIRRDSEGPALFKQKRVGENGRLFTMYKFRTMFIDAEERLKEVIQYDENGKPVYKFKDDPRVTPVGAFLRRTSLDELPQLINVLKGEMSLVGPRPELPWLVQHYDLWQHKRLTVPQGITGWWQINGRSDKPMHLHTEDDIYYIQNYSFFLDIFILWKTVAAVFKRKGAY